MELVATLLRGSLSFGMLIGAVIVGNVLSGQPSTKYFVGSMICWFIILGPLRWFNNAVFDVVEAHSDPNRRLGNAGDQFRVWSYFLILLGLSGYGIYLLVVAVSLLA